MSAYMVSKGTINALVWLATRPGDRWVHGISALAHSPDDIEAEIAKRLIAENLVSVNHRYPDTVGNADALPGDTGVVDPAYAYAPPRRFPSPIEGIKLIEHYAYQACEHPGWAESWAHGFCERMTKHLIGKLPGYDAAPWGWDDEMFKDQPAQISLSDLARSGRVRR